LPKVHARANLLPKRTSSPFAGRQAAAIQKLYQARWGVIDQSASV
jgi:hypothetical protein